LNQQRLQNCCASVDALREYVEEPITSKRDFAGLAFGFVMAFELAWRCAQDRVTDLGYAERGPKPVLSAALKSGLIQLEDEDAWSTMLEDRNLASHVYDERFARDLARRISETHLPALTSLMDRLANL
jgi:nucleotidyltransferase substrate binding protein (TIGR01987 family)